MNRRSFFGVLGAGAIAGKKAVHSAADALRESRIQNALKTGGKLKSVSASKSVYYDSVPESGDSEWTASYWINRLKRAFKSTEYEESIRRLRIAKRRREMEIEGLRSVSFSRKITMLEENEYFKSIEDDIVRYKNRLHNVENGRGPYDDGEE